MAFDLAGPDTLRTPTTHVLPATPDTCWWGYIDRDEPPRLKIASGDIVEIEAVTHHAGDAPDLLMDDGIRLLWESIGPDRRGPGPHILTGPIAVEGAEPGDTLAVRILSMRPRLPYGSNCAANWGLLYRTFAKERITIHGLERDRAHQRLHPHRRRVQRHTKALLPVVGRPVPQRLAGGSGGRHMTSVGCLV